MAMSQDSIAKKPRSSEPFGNHCLKTMIRHLKGAIRIMERQITEMRENVRDLEATMEDQYPSKKKGPTQ